MDLVIVESPAKAKTINGYLGSGYRVLASFGHVRDLEAKDGAVDPEHDFAMRWQPSADRAKQLKEIAEAAKGAARVILATDPDREGEAISWHLYEWLKAKKSLPAHTERVTFNAITKSAVLAAMAAPRALDQPLIDAYRARRALDYLVGFTLSPVLWRKLPGAKSAGRVQSVALRLIVDREREIEAFRAVEYWSVVATVAREGLSFPARLVQWRGKKLDKLSIGDAGDAAAAKADVEGAAFAVESVERKPGQRQPQPPFTTSTLQQEAARKLGFTAQHTMRLAQSLYEAGAITYMRTDGVQMAAEAIQGARAEIGRLEREWDRASAFDAKAESYLPAKPRVYTVKAKNAQEAHEAVRPTDFATRESASGDEAKLYQLIWRRALASQMANALLERTAIEFAEPGARHRLRATGQVIVFPGFMRLYEEGRDEAGDDDEGRLPSMAVGEVPAIAKVEAEQHFTQPPPRFGEASLVKRMEELGIGRPSTYASILQVLRDRNYVRMEAKRFLPEDSGRLVTAFLERYFNRYVSYDYTAKLEERLDEVSAGDADWVQVLREFWEAFRPAADEVMAILPSEVTSALDEFLGDYLFPQTGEGDPRLCPLCALGHLHLKGGKSGAFVGCDRYPECRYTRPFAGAGAVDGAVAGPEELGIDPETGEPITRRSGRFGPYVQRGDGEKPPRASIPKDVPEIDLAMALRLLALPRTVGTHPETGEPIKASIGRYGPYLAHAGKYARLQTTEDVLQIGMNLAVAALADAAQRGPRKGGTEPLRVVGVDPATGAEVKLMAGRYGPYVSNGETNASLAKGADPAALTLDEALSLIATRAESAPAAKGKRKPAKKSAVAGAGPKAGAKVVTKAKPTAKATPAAKATAAAKAKPSARPKRAATAKSAKA